MDQITAICQSPVAIALIMAIACVYLEKRLRAFTAAAEKREVDCIARVQALEQRHVDYLENQGTLVIKALADSTEATRLNVAAQNNGAACLERNSQATERLTEAYRKTPLTDA